MLPADRHWGVQRLPDSHSIRVSLHAYNNEDDVRALSQALESIGRHENHPRQW